VGGCSSSNSSFNASKGCGGLMRRQRQQCGRVRCANGEDVGAQYVCVYKARVGEAAAASAAAAFSSQGAGAAEAAAEAALWVGEVCER
jgi:hypothetical protein